MTGRERIRKTFRLEKTDRIPWLPFVGSHAASLIDITSDVYLRNEDVIVRGMLQASELYAPVIRWDGGSIDAAALLSTATAGNRSVRADIRNAPPPNLQSATVTLKGTMNPDRLRNFIASLPDAYYRVKGIVKFPSGPFLVEGAIEGWSIQPIRAFKGDADNFMIFIARAPDEKFLQSGFERCALKV